MILNEMVLDVTDYAELHPGGKFMIKINVGRDISKFFYGGYCLDGNLTSMNPEGYNHSNYAKLVVNDLTVGLYHRETHPMHITCFVDKKKTHMWNDTTATVKFENIDKKRVTCFVNFHNGMESIGKHYKLRSHKNMDVHRHYTICNTMQPEMYNGLLKCLKSGGDVTAFDVKMLKEGALAARHICLTMKNYKQDKGFSFRPFDKDDNFGEFEVFGPIGKGLGVDSDSVCVAYAGGTGVLTFLDLVGAIARYNLGLVN